MEKEIKEYIIVKARSTEEIVIEVHTKMLFGYQPLGGICAYHEAGNTKPSFYQSMVKYE